MKRHDVTIDKKGRLPLAADGSFARGRWTMKLFDEIPLLDDGYLSIRRIEEKDAEVLEEMSKNSNVRAYLPTFLFEYRFEDKREAVSKCSCTVRKQATENKR